MVRRMGISQAARSLFMFPLGLLAVPHLRCESGSAPLQSCLEGGIPGTDGNAALVLFREIVAGRRRRMKCVSSQIKSNTVIYPTIFVFTH